MLSLIVMLAFAAPQAANPAPLPPAPVQGAASAGPADAKPAAPKKVCVKEATLGSHFKRRVCATPEEWEQRRRRDTEAAARTMERNSSCSGPSC